MIKGIYVTNKRQPGKPVRWYVYAWRGGPQLMTKVGGGRPTLGPDEITKYRDILAQYAAERANLLAGLIRDYRASAEWKKLAANTRRNWDIIVDLIEAKWGKSEVAFWSDPRMVTKVMAWRNEAAATPRAADNRITVLRHMLEWARLNGRVLVNVAQGIPQLYDGGDRADIIWTEDDIARFEAAAIKAELPHIVDGLRLACLTGLRRADLVDLKWSEVGDNAIIRIAQKSSHRKRRKVVVPIIRELRALLKDLRDRDRKEGVDTVLVNSRGTAWSGDGFGNSIIRIRAAAGIVHDDGREKHLHDCRGTYATKLILAGLTDQEAAGIMGWSPERVANIRKVYVDQARVIVAIAERLDGTNCQPIVNRSGATNEN